MSSDEFPISWRDPQYVGAVVSVLTTDGVAFYAGLTDGPPTPETAMFVCSPYSFHGQSPTRSPAAGYELTERDHSDGR